MGERADEFLKEALACYCARPPKFPRRSFTELSEEIRELVELNLKAVHPMNNGITRVETKPFSMEIPGMEFCELAGFDSGGRQCMSVQLGSQGDEVGVKLKLAQDNDIKDVQFGERDTGKDNTVILAVLLLSVIRAFHGGYAAFTNTPYNDILRRFYRRMGFLNGERLNLADRTAIEKCLRWIGCQLEAMGPDPRAMTL